MHTNLHCNLKLNLDLQLKVITIISFKSQRENKYLFGFINVSYNATAAYIAVNEQQMLHIQNPTFFNQQVALINDNAL